MSEHDADPSTQRPTESHDATRTASASPTTGFGSASSSVDSQDTTANIGEDAAGANKSASKKADYDISVGDVFVRIYRLLHSKLTAVVVILAMAILAFIGTLVMQAPMSKRLDPAGYEQWLQTAQTKYGGWANVFDFLGFFNMWTSPLFLGVSVLLGLSIIACTTHRLPQLIDKTLKPRTHVSDRFFDNAQYRAAIPVAQDPSGALENTKKLLKKHHFRLVADNKAPDSRLFADRFRFGPFGTVIAHASFVIILAAFAVSAFTGFEENLDIAIGDSTEVGFDTGLAVEAVSFEDTYDEMGRPLDYVSHLLVKRGDQVVADQDVRVNTPIVVDGVRFHQASYGVAAKVTVQTEDGTMLVDRAVALKWTSNDGMNSIGRVDLPDQNLQIIVVAPASGQRMSQIEAGSVLFEIYNLATGEQLGTTTVDQGTTAQAGPLTVGFEREAKYTGIIVRKDPGTAWMWVGSILLIIGMVMTFGFRHRRLWVRVEPTDAPGVNSTVYIASVEAQDAILEHQFLELVEEINKQSNNQGGSNV